MGSKYTSKATSGYNSVPPPDDGTVSAANKITWASIKTKLTDVLKTFGEAINSALVTALDTSTTTQSAAYTTLASDHQKPIEVTGTTTISLGDASTMGAGYQATVVNTGAATVTVAVITATDTLDGTANGTTTLLPGQSQTFEVNSTANGYVTVASGNAKGSGFATNALRIQDSTDRTKQIAVDASGITTGTTRTWTAPNYGIAPGKYPTRQTFTSGSGTYTTPTGAIYIKIRMVGGGGGGAGSATSPGAAGSGGNTTFSTLTASGGGAGVAGVGSASGGTGTNGDINISGGTGETGISGTASRGGDGGGTPFGAGAWGGSPSTSNVGSAQANTGCGGGGAASSATSPSGGGGAGGGYIEKLITAPSATYSYAVGAAGAAGTAGTGGSAGGAGGSGLIIVDEFYA